MQADAKRDLPGPEQPQFHAASPPSAPSTSTQQQAGLRDVPTTAENVGRKHNTKYDNYAKTDHEIFRALHLFSGRSGRKDGLATLLRAQGWECEDIDIVNASLPGEQRSDHDLLDDELWLSIRKWLLDGEYDFVWLGTPCATFSAARWQIIPGNPNAPRSLRDFCYPWGYNGPTVDDDTIPHLTTKEKEDLKQGDIFAQKSAEIFELCRSLGILGKSFSTTRQPVSFRPRNIQVSCRRPTHALQVDFAQCPYGSPTVKPTIVVYWGADFAQLDWGQCPHKPRSWTYTQWNGSSATTWGKHPPPTGQLISKSQGLYRSSSSLPCSTQQTDLHHNLQHETKACPTTG